MAITLALLRPAQLLGNAVGQMPVVSPRKVCFAQHPPTPRRTRWDPPTHLGVRVSEARAGSWRSAGVACRQLADWSIVKGARNP